MPPLQRREPLTFDTAEHRVETKYCTDCSSHYARVTGYVHEPNGGATLASYYAVCHGHPQHEVALDLTLGTWGGQVFDDHETFSCLIRPYPYGVMAVDPFVTLAFPDGDQPAFLGRPMRREAALQSPRITTVWAIVDALIEGVAPIAEQVHASGDRADEG